MDIINKIKMVDNDLVTTIISTKEDFEELLDEKNVLSLSSFSITKIKKFIQWKGVKGSYYIALDCNNLENLDEVKHFIDLNIPVKSSKFYRVLLVSHETLHENLDLLLWETVVLFSDDKLSLENI